MDFNKLSHDEQQDIMDSVDKKTPTNILVAILTMACSSLNHEDEEFVPAIREACRRLTANKE